MESIHDRVVASRVYAYRFAGIHRMGGGAMTAFEIVSTILAVASLMVATGMFVVALLTFLQKRKKRK